MRIGILSDTHGDLVCFDQAMEIIGNADHIIHCGDVLPNYSRFGDADAIDALAQKIRAIKNISIVRGNGDTKEHARSLGHDLSSPYLLTDIGPYRFFVTHGHHYSMMQMIWKAKELGADIVCFGHSHIKVLDSDGEILVLNPGSTSLPRDGSRSCAVLEDDAVSIYDLETKEILGHLSIPDRSRR
ncbi:MAG: phosphodiesterase [Peptostreptococcaceae bacterium]|nr:phosphodiesterase [Peptostreptococcaceae bacterium]